VVDVSLIVRRLVHRVFGVFLAGAIFVLVNVVNARASSAVLMGLSGFWHMWIVSGNLS